MKQTEIIIPKSCASCKKLIHPLRLKILPHANTCVNCSTAKPVGCVPINSHKTGNTIQILPHDMAASMNKNCARSGYGITRSLRGKNG